MKKKEPTLLFLKVLHFGNVKKIKVIGEDGKLHKIPISQPHLIYISALAPHLGIEVSTATQELALEASDQLVQQDLRMFFYSLTNMAYWVNRKRDKRGLHHDTNMRLELNFIEEVFRLLETRHKVLNPEGEEVGYISAHLKIQEDPGFWKETKEYLRHRDPKDQKVRNKAVELSIRKACKRLELPCK